MHSQNRPRCNPRGLTPAFKPSPFRPLTLLWVCPSFPERIPTASPGLCQVSTSLICNDPSLDRNLTVSTRWQQRTAQTLWSLQSCRTGVPQMKRTSFPRKHGDISAQSYCSRADLVVMWVPPTQYQQELCSGRSGCPLRGRQCCASAGTENPVTA